MNEQIQIIRKDGEPEYAVLPYCEYERLRDAAEVAEDIAVYDRAKASTNAEHVPGEVVRRLVDGENPVRVWREHRGLAQGELAKRLDIAKDSLSRIEAGEQEGTFGLYRELSRVLDVSLDELVGWQDSEP